MAYKDNGTLDTSGYKSDASDDASERIKRAQAQAASELVMRDDSQELIRMLSYMRPSGERQIGDYKEFLDKYIEPVFGEPDKHGNYVKIIKGDDDKMPRVAYMAHHDTVHMDNGRQNDRIVYHVDNLDDVILSIKNGEVPMIEMEYVCQYGQDKGKKLKRQVRDPEFKDYSSCLGADCTTGVWLILEMIKAECPGIYVIHADEEIGCLGSKALVKDFIALDISEKQKHWLYNLELAISLDRYGETSIITYQMSSRTASDDFARQLSHALATTMLAKERVTHEADTGGSYTDSNEYADFVKECTNLSVGYEHQHGTSESQNLTYVLVLRDALVAAAKKINDFQHVGAYRDPMDTDYLYGGYGYGKWSNGSGQGYRNGTHGYGYYNDDYYDDDSTYFAKSGNGGKGNAKKTSLYIQDDENYAGTGDILKSTDLDDIETRYSEHLDSMIIGADYSADVDYELDIESLALLMSNYPYIMASLFRRNGMFVSNARTRMKDEAYRLDKFLQYNAMFGTNLPQEEESIDGSRTHRPNLKDYDDEIPF